MINYIEVATQSLGCTQTALAKQLGVHKAVLTNWKRRGIVPVRRVKKFSEVTGIPCYVLAPDFFPAPKIDKQKAEE